MTGIKAIPGIGRVVRNVKASGIKAKRAARPRIPRVKDSFEPTENMKLRQANKQACYDFVSRLFKTADGNNPNITKKQATDRIVVFTKKNDRDMITRYFVRLDENGKFDGNFEYVKSYPDNLSVRRYADGRVAGRIGKNSPNTICKWGRGENGTARTVGEWRSIKKVIDKMKDILSE